MTGAELREHIRTALKSLELTSESEFLESLELTCYVLGLSRDRFYAVASFPVSPVRDVKTVVSRRLSGEPLAYIIGEWDFAGITLKTDARALIPRDDTVTCLELFLRNLPPEAGKFLDLCTGTGCIGLATLKQKSRLSAILADISEDCLALAKENATALNLLERVSFVRADVFEAPPFAEGSLSGLVSNPPYVESDEVDPDTREPKLALDGGPDGLRFYRRIISEWAPVLKKNAPMCFEVGYNQGEAVARLLRDAGFHGVTERKDLQGILRAVCGLKS